MGMSHFRLSLRWEGEIAQHSCKPNNLTTPFYSFYQNKVTGSASLYIQWSHIVNTGPFAHGYCWSFITHCNLAVPVPALLFDL